MFNFAINPDYAVQALIGICGVVSAVIAWILDRRKKAKGRGDLDEPTRNDLNAYMQIVLADRDRREREHRERERDLERKLERALQDAAEAWRVRESQTSQIATLTQKNENLEGTVVRLEKQLDLVMKAIRRTNPEFLAAFGSDFTPLS